MNLEVKELGFGTHTLLLRVLCRQTNLSRFQCSVKSFKKMKCLPEAKS